MTISGINKLTLLDYPEHLACIVFTQGCNFNCKYCHNTDLIPIKTINEINTNEVLEYLEKRKDVLEGVVISGGEPLLQPKIKDFIKQVKELGFKVKLDTNGTNLKLLKELVDEKLIDYIAMDIKGCDDTYSDITKSKLCTSKIKETINYIKDSGIDHEFRTTIIKCTHGINNIKKILEIVGNDSKYYLQNFEDNESISNKELRGFSESELKTLEKELRKEYPNVKVRGI